MKRRPSWIRKPRSQPNGTRSDHAFVSYGRYLTSRQALRLETLIAKDPTDVGSRLQLIGYYGEHPDLHWRTRSLVWAHKFWMIENRPADYACYYFGRPQSQQRADEYKRTWLRQVRKHASNWNVLCNAANCLLYVDEALGYRLFHRALKLKPKWGLPARRIAQSYRAKAIKGPRDQRANSAKNAFKYAQLALKLQDSPGEKKGILTEFTHVAIKYHQFDLARRWANRLVRLEFEDFTMWQQYGYVYLTALEYAQGNLHRTKIYLAKLTESFKKAPCHVMSHPMLLALLQDLVAQGETETVLFYADAACEASESNAAKKQWRAWATILRRGKTPAFEWTKVPPWKRS